MGGGGGTAKVSEFLLQRIQIYKTNKTFYFFFFFFWGGGGGGGRGEGLRGAG